MNCAKHITTQGCPLKKGDHGEKILSGGGNRIGGGLLFLILLINIAVLNLYLVLQLVIDVT